MDDNLITWWICVCPYGILFLYPIRSYWNVYLFNGIYQALIQQLIAVIYNDFAEEDMPDRDIPGIKV